MEALLLAKLHHSFCSYLLFYPVFYSLSTLSHLLLACRSSVLVFGVWMSIGITVCSLCSCSLCLNLQWQKVD